MTTDTLRRNAWWLVAAATATLMVTMGIRQSLGLFVQPIHSGTGLTIVQISFALAIAQLAWGAAQPVFGAWADKRGPGRVLVFGGVLLVIGMALTPFLTSQWGLVLTLGLLSAAGAGAREHRRPGAATRQNAAQRAASGPGAGAARPRSPKGSPSRWHRSPTRPSSSGRTPWASP